MRILRVDDSVRPPSLVCDEVPAPRPGQGEVLIRVFAAGIIPTELSWYPTTHRPTGEARSRAVPAHEFSGVVEDAGEDVGHLEIGHEVFGMNDWYCDGALAECCVAPYFALAPKPPRLTHAEAASVPISALTAWQGLFDRANVRHGERVLVHGGAGAVGGFAIQLARIHGAHAIATASARNRDFVASLGAGQVIDYRESRFEERVKDADVVFDTVGGETLDRSWSVLKPGGRMVTVASTAVGSTDARVRKAFFIVTPNQHQLAEIGALLDAGLLRPIVDAVIPLSEAPAAFAGKVPRQGRGKLVVAIANGNGTEGKEK
jgi:NADPH:quinone reductase-like Zn-dependent oxidoreductase